MGRPLPVLIACLYAAWGGVAAAGDASDPFALAEAMRAYRGAHLSLRQEALEVASHDPWEAPEILDEWVALYRGGDRLEVPEFLATTGAWREHFALEQRARRAQRAATALYVLGGVGAVATVTGFLGTSTFTGDPLHDRFDHSVITGGIVAMLGGLIGGTLPQTRAWRLRNRPEVSLTPARMHALGGAYNAGLRRRLGLAPDVARAIGHDDLPGAVALEEPAAPTGYRPFVIRPADAARTTTTHTSVPDG